MGTGYYLGWHITISEFVTAWKRAMGMVKGTRAMALLLWRVELTGRTGCSSQFLQLQHLRFCQAEMLSTAEWPHPSLWQEKDVWRWTVWRLLGSIQKLTSKGNWETGNCQEFCLNSAWTCRRIRSFWKTHWSVLFKTSFAMPSSPRETHQNLGHMHFPL